MKRYALTNTPTVDEYVVGLQAIFANINDIQFRLLKSQYAAPNRMVTAPQLAELAEVKGGHAVVNSHYGRLGHMYCDETGLEPTLRPNDKARWWSVWSCGYSHPDGFLWEMNPQVARALEILGWVDPQDSESTFQTKVLASDVESNATSRSLTTTLRIIRDTTLARLIKELHENKCQICGATIDLSQGKSYSEAHHIQPLGQPHHGPDVSKNILILCPNHHAMCDFGAIHLSFTSLRLHPKHQIGKEFIQYHNEMICS